MKFTKSHKRLINAVLASLLLLFQLASPLVASAEGLGNQNNNHDDSHKITICHRTASYSNPYEMITVDQDAADGNAGNDHGQGDHYLEHQGPVFYPSIPKHTEWGDIIPPIPGVHNGLNWTADGQTILQHDCNLPQGKVEVNKKVDANGDGIYEGGNLSANNLGFSWALDDETPSRLMGTHTDAFVGAHTVTEKMVNGYAFTGWYYTTDTDYSCTHPRGTTLPVDITVANDQTTKVTLCNKLQTGTITIIKDAQPNSSQTFDFTINKQQALWGQNFTLDDDGNTNNTYSNTKTFSALTTGSYVVSEGKTTDWNLNNIVCSDGATVVTDKATGKVTISLGPNDSVTCTFVNQKIGGIKVYKHTLPAEDPTSFAINASGSGEVYGNSDRWIADGQYQYFDTSQGTYNITETVPAGWVQTENTCVNVVVSPENLDPTCDITNTKLATLTIAKQANPQSAQDFAFVSEQLGNFSLDDDNDPTLPNSQTFDNLTPGTYDVSEQYLEGWDLNDLWCEGTDSYGVNWEASGLQVELAPGDDVTCTFVNHKHSGIGGYKFNDVNGNGKWDEGEKTLEGWKITLTKNCTVDRPVTDSVEGFFDNLVVSDDCASTKQSTTTDANGYYYFDDLQAGNYTVCEEMQPGWMQTFPGGPTNCHELTIASPGSVLEADFGNHTKPNDPQVLGASTSTPSVLVNTGTPLLKYMLAALTILGIVGALHFVPRRKEYNQ